MLPPGLAAALAPGTVISGKYRVEQPLGTAGMGVVVAARHAGRRSRAAARPVACTKVAAYGVTEPFACSAASGYAQSAVCAPTPAFDQKKLFPSAPGMRSTNQPVYRSSMVRCAGAQHRLLAFRLPELRPTMSAPQKTHQWIAVCLALCGCERDAAEAAATDWPEVRRQFVANQDAANKHFKGKHVEWAGTVSSTAQRLAMEEGLFAVLHPKAGKKDTAFIAFFDNDMRDEVFALRPGQRVTVSCRIDHISTKYLEVAVSLESCRLANVTPLSPEKSAEIPPPRTVNVPDRAPPLRR